MRPQHSGNANGRKTDSKTSEGKTPIKARTPLPFRTANGASDHQIATVAGYFHFLAAARTTQYLRFLVQWSIFLFGSWQRLPWWSRRPETVLIQGRDCDASVVRPQATVNHTATALRTVACRG